MIRILFSFLLLLSLSVQADTDKQTATWEVAVVFLGAGEDDYYQADVDKNILELARTEPNSKYHLAVLRDYIDKTVQYIHSPKTSQKLSHWDPLFKTVPQAKIQIPGELKTLTREQGTKTVLDSKILKAFFEQAFQAKDSKKMLVIYGHGEAFQGLRAKRLLDLQKVLESSLKNKLDILWFDSCFMGSVEALYQLRNLTSFFIASQDAEFSAGTPFNSFADLQEGPSDVEAQAREFAAHFVESYSFIKEGSQTGAVGKSAATVSVIHSKEIERLVFNLRIYSKKFTSKLNTIVERATSKISMDKKDYVDLGMLLKVTANLPTISKPIETLEEQLELNRKLNIRTNPRIELKPPQEGSLVIFGYENWTRGFENDPDILERLPANLKPTAFINGPKDKKWPSRKINKRIYVSPFMPGIQVFNYIYSDGNKSTFFPKSYTRTQDFVTFVSSISQNPILFSAYTQSIGSNSEKYTGLNIANPTIGIPTLDYVDTDFYKQTNWGSWK